MNSNTQTSEALQTLQEFLIHLFQFDTADLDFGIYKILHYKKAEVEAFIHQLLTEKVREQLNILSTAENEHLFKQVNELEKTTNISKYLSAVRKKDAQRMAIYEEDFKEDIERYQSLRSQLDHQISTNEAEPLIYNHLTLFFNRYYDAGDFIRNADMANRINMWCRTMVKKPSSTGPMPTSITSKAVSFSKNIPSGYRLLPDSGMCISSCGKPRKKAAMRKAKTTSILLFLTIRLI